MKVRKATLADANDIAQIHFDSWNYAYAPFLPDDNLIGKPNTERTKENIQSGLHYFVAIDDSDKVIGFIAGGQPRSPILKTDSEIGMLYCAPAYLETGRGGAGRALMAALAQELGQQGKKTIGVGCLSNNKGALEFYKRMGGRIIAEIPWIKNSEYNETFLELDISSL